MTLTAAVKKLFRHSSNALSNLRLHRLGKCPICGYFGPFYAFDAKQPEEMLLCPLCRSISRQRAIACQLMHQLGLPQTSIHSHARSGLTDFDILDTAGMAPLSRMGGARQRWIRGAYSEDGRVPPHCRFADLQNLNLPDESLDVLISEDVLEHVPDIDSAFSEIARVLKPGGFHLFTVPRYNDIQTRRRAELDHGEINHLIKPQYHYDPSTDQPILVFHDFGFDFDEYWRNAGLSFDTLPAAEIPGRNLTGRRPVFIARKPRR